MYVQHETVTDELQRFLPEYTSPFQQDPRRYTSAFLILPKTAPRKEPEYSQDICSRTKKDGHAGFREVIDYSTLALSGNQRQRFVKAMKALNLIPFYHLTELESMISPVSNDATFWEICSCKEGNGWRQSRKLPGCPEPTPFSLEDKAEKLEQYLDGKNQGQCVTCR
jgi:hypothetical protein